ncbi:hypothetical protein Q5424_09315 [Conexibacter sp. JD483]|uniref:hypothetical protein n=1 Tax=unclassified Conexibacter TaxID=2627773 RepID=UPI00271B112F|nr:MULTISPECIES: hypothetical protein [unclassified Conexibacter]MDO8187225.1 hypothetical protein [Conexibacter sp. CPCC 205706]MDO8199322.1 hypothetical protein [Conexibacter sp. CPCC 205762]MDR9369277.1 hypothetical protein [Conexibacter sp. JD483]
MAPPEDYAAARYEALSERITHVKAGADRRAEQLGERIDRLADRLDARVEQLDLQKADQDDLDKASSLLDRILLGVLGASLAFGGGAVWFVVQIGGGR